MAGSQRLLNRTASIRAAIFGCPWRYWLNVSLSRTYIGLLFYEMAILGLPRIPHRLHKFIPEGIILVTTGEFGEGMIFAQCVLRAIGSLIVSGLRHTRFVDFTSQYSPPMHSGSDASITGLYHAIANVIGKFRETWEKSERFAQWAHRHTNEELDAYLGVDTITRY